MEKASTTKVIGLIWIFLLLLIATLGMVTTVQAEIVTIPSGDYTIAANSVYQLAEGYSGTITIDKDVTAVTVTDAIYKAHHDNTQIFVDSGRTSALELTIENINITASTGPGIGFGSAGSYDNRLYISGTCSVTGSTDNAGIYVPDGAALTIDKLHDDHSDQLTANGKGYGAGIGSDLGVIRKGGAITINGGTILATGEANSAGIGGGSAGAGGTITINGGIVTATSSNPTTWDTGGAGIGGGCYGDCGTITINGGIVTANGGVGGAGIGAGLSADAVGGIITINGGEVTANGGYNAAGIGCGGNGSGGAITIAINGGTVIATASNDAGGLTGGNGPGIGASWSTITISGGTVFATGAGPAAGIGGSLGTMSGIITISGGTVTAAGGNDFHGGGAGIGGGAGRAGGTIIISGGIITATGGDGGGERDGAGIGGGAWGAGGTIEISGGTITAAAQGCAAGIGGGGGGGGAGGNVSITGTPVVYATGGVANGAEHIGKGTISSDSGTLKDGSGTDLSYLRFSAAGLPGVIIRVDGINNTYVTNDQGICGIFVPRSGSAVYTASKAGYEAVRGTQDISSMNYDLNIPMVADNTSSGINNVTPLLLQKGTSLEVTFNNDYGIYGTLYLVPKAGPDYTSKEALDEVTGVRTTVVNSPATTGNIDTAGLAQGTYQVYLADSAENLSAPSQDIVVDNLPEITAVEKAADDTYVDLVLSEGIYGAADGVSKLTKDKLRLIFTSHGGTATGAEIISVKKDNSTEEVAASELQGGEDAVRVFIEVTGTSAGIETIEIKPADGSSIYDIMGKAMPEAQTTGAMLLKDSQAPTVSNGNISISNTTPTGTTLIWNKASDLATTEAELKYCIYQSTENNMNILADIEANGTVKQEYTSDIGTLDITGLQPGSTYYFNVVVKDNAGNKTCYNTVLVTTRAPSSGSGGIGNHGNNINTITAKTIEIIIPISALAGDAGKTTEIKTELAIITLPSNMLTPEAAGNAVSATLLISMADKSQLPVEVLAQVGGRPVLELSLRLDGKAVSWNNPDAPVKVTIPYTPTAEELTNPENITVWYIDVEGNITAVPSGRYDPVTGTVSFATTHFSKYAVVYVTKTYSDLGSVVWAREQIEILAAKGIFNDAAETEYAPQTNITRADFLYFLVRTLDVDAEVDGNFDDIYSDAYYYKEIGIAKKLGITSGTGNNKFSPYACLTRQDMMVMTDRALRILKKLEVHGMASDLEKFSDKSLVAAYAVNGVASVVKEGLIVGSSDKLNPLNNTTRADTAVFLYRLYNKLYK